MRSMKKCIACGLEKSPADFYAHPSMADGLLNKCKECHKAAIRAKRSERIEHYRAYDRKRARNPERIKNSTEHTRMWRKEDKRRTAAHNAVSRALRSGRLVRQPCERCGEEQSYAHHESYDRKLDVKWLCQPCHKQRHKELAIAGIEP